jgi:hypothetical protein
MHLLASRDGSIPAFPRVLAVVQVDDHVLLIDHAHSTLEYDLKLGDKAPTGQLGRLRGARFHNAGNLVLSFEQGALLLAFAEDMVIAATASGALYVKDSGIAHTDLTSGFTLMTPPAEGKANATPDVKMHGATRLLALTPGLLVTDTGAESFSFSHAHGVQITDSVSSEGSWREAQMIPGKDSAATVLSVLRSGSRATATTLALNATPTLTLTASTDSTSVDPNAGELRLVAGQILWRRGDGWASPLDSKEQYTPTMAIAGARLAERVMSATGTILIKQNSPEPGQCDWTRHRLRGAEVTAATTFKDPLLTVRCDCSATVDLNLASSNGTEALTLRDKRGSLKTYLFLPQND